MANPINDIYTSVCAALDSITGSTINWYEKNMNQDKPSGEDLPIDYPAVIFKCNDVIWENTGLPRQGSVNLEVKVIHRIDDNAELLRPSSAGRNGEVRRNNDLVTITNKIEGLSTSTFNRLRKLNDKDEIDNENMLVINTSNYFCNIMTDASPPAPTFTIDFGYVADLNQLLNHNKCCK